MATLAAATSDYVMVDSWEALQPGWQRTLAVMRRVSVVCLVSPLDVFVYTERVHLGRHLVCGCAAGVAVHTGHYVSLFLTACVGRVDA